MTIWLSVTRGKAAVFGHLLPFSLFAVEVIQELSIRPEGKVTVIFEVAVT